MDKIGWLKFSELCEPSFGKCLFQESLIAECDGNEDIASAVFYHLGENSITWLHQNIPALKEKTPTSLILSNHADEVRKILWKMP